MSTTAGYFDETILNNIRRRASEIMFDDRIKQQFDARYDILKAVQAVQTANVYPSIARNKKVVDVDVIWENVCGSEVEANTTCEIGGDKSSTNLKNYELTYEYAVNFSADEADFDDNEFEMAIAKQFLKADKNLTEHFAQYAAAQIDSFSGWNVLTTGKGTVDGADTYIPAAYWNASLAAYFNRVAIMNKFTSPIMLSGNNLYESMWVAKANAANANGKGDAIMYGDMNMYFDMFNIDTVNSPDLKTYLLSMGSLALASRALNPERPEVLMEHTRYKMSSRYLPFEYDVFYKNSCTTNDRTQHDFKVKLVADIFINPTGCDDNNTCVLSFVCGEAP